MRNRKLGKNGPAVPEIGLGCMSLGIADVYSSSLRSADDAVALIHRALDLGVGMLDTADVYGDSEAIVGRALEGRRDGVVLASKFGFVADRIGAGGREEVDGRPEYVRASCDASLKKLGVDCIDLYYLHRVDAKVPIEETIGAMADLVRLGKVRHLGVSEAAPETVRRAHATHPLAAVQVEYSLWSRDPEDALLPVLEELDIALVAYSPLGRGFLAGRFKSIDDLAADDWRRGSPRFQGENFAANLHLVDKIAELAANKGCTPSQLALAWVLAQNDRIVPIPGTSSVARLAENVAAADLELTARELAEIDAIAPRGVAVGARYHAAGERLLNR